MGFYFSKSKYCLLWQCPKQVWLYKYRPELKKHDPAVEARMIAGQEVGELAKPYFGPYTDVSVVNEDGSLDLDAMLAKTQILVDMGEENICEASFCYDGLYCAVDILHQENGGYAIYEVKSSTHEAEIYGVDIAYQKYGVRYVYWCVAKDNTRAIRFYDKNGYPRVSAKEISITGGYTKEQIDSYIWYKVEK